MKKKNGKILDKVIKLLNPKKAQQPIKILQNFQVLFHAKFNVFFKNTQKKSYLNSKSFCITCQKTEFYTMIFMYFYFAARGFPMYKMLYETPRQFGNLFLFSDGRYLTGVCFEGSKDEVKHSACTQILTDSSAADCFCQTITWLDLYFAGKVPDFVPEFKIENLTPFRQQVLNSLMKIPFGQTVTYGSIAQEFLCADCKKMSAQAVGSAVGWNPIGIIIPCHRVVGSSGNLTGYGGGLKNKAALLNHELFYTFNLSASIIKT